MYRPNWIELDGVVNMRDLGGMVTAGGDTVRPHRLLRSDNLQDLTPEAVEVLVSRVGLRDVVDLRTHVEVAKEGDGPLRAVPVVRHHHHTLYREDSLESGIPAAERALPWESDERRYTSTAGSPDPANGSLAAANGSPEPAIGSPEPAIGSPEPAIGSPEPANAPERRPSHDEFWSEHYLSYLASRPDSVVAALHDIASSDGAVVVHCAAGKDRTGTVVGLALKAVGVPDELVIADYAASAERVGAIMDRLRVKPAYAANLRDKTVAQQSPTTDTMRLLLATLDERFGGALGWLGIQGWTRSDTDRLRRKLLDD